MLSAAGALLRAARVSVCARASSACVSASVLRVRRSLSVSASVSADAVDADGVFERKLDALLARLAVDLPREVVAECLTHPSYLAGRGGKNHDRFEFLGDRVLSFFVAERLVTSFPNMTSEHLTDAQQLLVNNRTLAAVAKGFGIHDVMRWSPTSSSSDVAGEAKVSADCVEALIGALYEHRGAAAVRQFIDSRIWSRFKDIEGSLVWSNPKTYLQRLMSKAGRGVPEYRLVAETGRFTHAPVFKVAVVVDDKQLGTATGRSIRDAESNAAVNVLREHFSTMNPHPELRSTHDLAAPLS